MTELRRLTGWGRTAATTAYVEPVRRVEDAVAAVRLAGDRGLIARGLGRSYGDAAQNAGGSVLDMTGLDRIVQVDAETRTAVVQAGVTLDTLMRTLLPFGLWVPVLPGTRQVSVGGAIAADVHGKNHHVEGSFGNHVRSVELLTADGVVRTLRPDDASTRDLFWATVGGMGLTGVVLQATVGLHDVDTAYFLVDTERAHDVYDLMQRLAGGDAHYPYSVAWFDSIASGDRLGRAVITRGRAAEVDELPTKLRGRPLRFDAPGLGTVPPGIPGGLVNRITGRAFNELWFRKAPASRRAELQNITTFFHPLDVVADWNRVYGPRGFCQYQFVVPEGAEPVLRRCVQIIAGSGHVSCLNVLKRFGPANRSPLSFPTAGWTLAVDIAVRPGLERLFARLDAMVLEAGGRVYLAKDARLPAAQLRRMYPRLEEFARIRRQVDPAGMFCSDLSRRLEID
ncbi:MAG TPA: FAD-binding oxidoreductase [Nocardioidaceae bacterium]|nr:FAD-binding oxidoreductase [Nocardioidaceae bacterium]